ncbi:Hypothetical protein, putative [Bodo saltans]|uniref:Uncharacterized protein n=1 Tax=Bodo saltans TaxID=75058 RepID=A0A0S4ITH0_BODSA|nr:Hypothetical protein, putative [Bodo saltans]|eukprot:CUF84054.1 Hypothetical protein, putative [Bodo saltans]
MSRASPHYLQTMKSFESTASSPIAPSRAKNGTGGDAQQRSLLPIHTVAASTSNVTSAREDSTSSSRTEGSAGINGLLSDRGNLGMSTDSIGGAPPGTTTILVDCDSRSPAAAQEILKPQSVKIVAENSYLTQQPGEREPAEKVVTLDAARSPTRSDQHRPLSAASRRSVSPSSWADFIERSHQDEVRRQQRIHSAPSQRRFGGKKDFYVASTLPGACLNPPAAPCYWREAIIEKNVLASADGVAEVSSLTAAALLNRPPFLIRPTSACSTVSGSAARVVRQLQQQRPASATPSNATRSSLLPLSTFADNSEPTSNELMSRWVSGGKLACGDSKPRKMFHRGATSHSKR